MKLNISQEGEVSVLEFIGEFDAYNLTATTKKIDSMFDAGEVRMVFDLRKLTFINSSALGYLIKARKRAHEAGGDLVLVHPSTFMRKTMVTLGIDRMFNIYETVEDAVAHFTKKRKPEMDMGDEIDEKLTQASSVMFSLIPPVGPKRYVGRISSLYGNGVKFRWSIPQWDRETRPPLSNANFETEFFVGRKMRIKFRQPLMAHDHFFEMDASITSIAHEESHDGTDEAVIVVRHENAKPEDVEMLSRYADDMADFKAELDQARKKRP